MTNNFTCVVSDCNLTVKNIHCLTLKYSLDCGQSFRWEQNDDGHWCAVVGSHYGELSEIFNADGTTDITFYNCTEKEFYDFWLHYLGLDIDYDSIINKYNDKYLKSAVKEFYGIRILNQDPWEALCSFIISQNNNIPRIKGIIKRLCESFGEKLPNGEYTFPSAEVISKLQEEDLAPLRAGFRNKYIIDAARKVASGEVDLKKIKDLPLADAEAELLKIKGVGPKVAQCALLYGCEQFDAFPIDVWVKRIMAELYPEGLPKCFDGTRGIAQQYLFHWRRNSVEFN